MRFRDDRIWQDLARQRGLRLPQASTKLTTAAMERWLRRLGVSVSAYREWSGERTLRDFAVRNPTWPLRAWVGLVLEALADGRISATMEGRP